MSRGAAFRLTFRLSSGTNVVKFADGKVLHTPTDPPANVANIDSVHFTIPADTTDATPFDFCLEKIEPITTGGTCDMGFVGAPDAGAGGGASDGGSTGALHGTLPSNVTASDVTTAYNKWKATYVKSCASGGSYVTNPQDNNNGYSEGIGYGMLLAVANGDQTTFDALYTFYSSHTNSSGLMEWKIAGCGAATSNAAATDGDLDSAMALVQATCKWPTGGYTAKATSLIGKIKALSTASGGLSLLRPGNAFTDATCFNPSYVAPGYYRAFAKIASDTSWNKLADDSYPLLIKVANGTTGLVPNWAHTDGSAPHGECNGTEAKIYGYDAARTPWRIATDYAWWGTAAAGSLLTKYVAFANKAGHRGRGRQIQPRRLPGRHLSHAGDSGRVRQCHDRQRQRHGRQVLPVAQGAHGRRVFSRHPQGSLHVPRGRDVS